MDCCDLNTVTQTLHLTSWAPYPQGDSISGAWSSISVLIKKLRGLLWLLDYALIHYPEHVEIRCQFLITKCTVIRNQFSDTVETSETNSVLHTVLSLFSYSNRT